jgi:H+-translocating NAD(P) transhydrogenase subunit alpha
LNLKQFIFGSLSELPMQNSAQPSVHSSTRGLIVRSIAASTLLLASMAIFATAFATPVSPALEAGHVTPEGVITKPNTPAVVETKTSPAETSNISKGQRIVASFTVYLLAVFIGVEVINKIPPTLHTPLMSGSNAISGITVIGSILSAGHAKGGIGAVLGTLAVILATINIAGGYIVTDRMLKMFKRR